VLYNIELDQSWSWRQHLSRFDIRENQITHSSVTRSANGNECTSLHQGMPVVIPCFVSWNWWSPQNSSLPPRSKFPSPSTHVFTLRPMLISSLVVLFPLWFSHFFYFVSFFSPPTVRLKAKHSACIIILLESTITDYDDTVTTMMLMRRGRGFTHPSHLPIVSRPTPFGLPC